MKNKMLNGQSPAKQDNDHRVFNGGNAIALTLAGTYNAI